MKKIISGGKGIIKSNKMESTNVTTATNLKLKPKVDLAKIVFEKGSVFIHTTQGKENDDVLLGGKVHLISKMEGAFVDWHPLSECDFEVEHPDTDWTVVNTVGYKNSETDNVSVHQAHKKSKYAMMFSLHDVKSIRRSKPDLGWAYLLFTLNEDDVCLPALHFHEGGSSEMLRKIERYVTLTRCPTDIRLFTVTPHNTAALTRSIDELQVLGEHSANYVQNFFRDPTVIMGGFSKVTNFVRDTLSGQPQQKFRPFDEYAELMPDMIGLIIDPSPTSQSFEMIAERKLGPRPEVVRSGAVTPNEWAGHVDAEGRMTDIDALKEKIFRGGLCPSVRKEAWPFLLEYYDWDSTTKMRKTVRKKKEDEYFCMKAQWKTLSEHQENRFGVYRERKNVIDKDVLRTDRIHPYYKGEDNPHLEMLNDVLMTYCQYNFDLGYVQGMSDMLSPILEIMDDEVDAFWCFSGFMEHPGMMSNFDIDQAGMKKQLSNLSTLLQFLDPDLFTYFESKECSNMYFCFRWLLIRFKREFSYEDISVYWELMWTGLPCMNFHLLMCLAILDTEQELMKQEDLGFNEILKHINELSLKIDMVETLKKAEGFYLQLSECQKLPCAIKEIIMPAMADSNLHDSDSSSIEILDEVLSDELNGESVAYTDD